MVGKVDMTTIPMKGPEIKVIKRAEGFKARFMCKVRAGLLAE